MRGMHVQSLLRIRHSPMEVNAECVSTLMCIYIRHIAVLMQKECTPAKEHACHSTCKCVFGRYWCVCLCGVEKCTVLCHTSGAVKCKPCTRVQFQSQ